MARRRTPRTHARRAVVYLRCSTSQQDLSPDAQLADIERWAAREGVELVEVHRDIGISGGTEAAARPGLMAALSALEVAKAGLLVVARRDRLARDIVVAASVEKLAKDRGARVVSADGVSSEETPEGMLMRSLVDAFGAYERALIRARIVAAMRVKKTRGEVVGAAPIGYAVSADGKHLEPVESEQAVVARIRALHAEGLPIRAIAARLNEEQLPARGRAWHPTSVARVLRAAA